MRVSLLSRRACGRRRTVTPPTGVASGKSEEGFSIPWISGRVLAPVLPGAKKMSGRSWLIAPDKRPPRESGARRDGDFRVTLRSSDKGRYRHRLPYDFGKLCRS